MIATLPLVAALFASTVSAGKRGLGWPWYNSAFDVGTLNNGDGEVVAIYVKRSGYRAIVDWETYAPPSTNGIGSLGFIGMQRCTDCDSSPVAQLASLQAAQGWATVFSLNEPDVTSLTPADAAAWYITYINPLSIKKALPAVTSSASAGQGLDWLAQMISACAGECSADYINLHWYGASFADFQSHVVAANSQFPSYSIVITEFALQNPAGGQSDQVAFFTEAFEWLDEQSYVTLYFPFVATSPSALTTNDAAGAAYVGTGSTLLNDDGTISAVGSLMF